MVNASRIRIAADADAAELSALMRETFTAANGHCTSPANLAAFLDSVYTLERQRREIANPEIRTLLVDSPSGDELIGFAQVRFATRPPLALPLSAPVELGRIYVSSEFHGQGLATALMQHVVDAARSRGGDGLWLSVWKEAPRAIAYYSKHDFRIAGSIVFTVGDDPKEDWLMVREFPAS